MKERVLRVQDLAVDFILREGGLFSPKTHVLKAVNGVSFDLSAGETLGIVGESGCGKSTLARALLALIKPSRGRVLWLGEDLNKLDEEALRKKRHADRFIIIAKNSIPHGSQRYSLLEITPVANPPMRNSPNKR